jgi:phage gp36-like protein
MNELRISYKGESDVYAILQEATTGKAWNPGTDALETFANADWAEYAVALAEMGGDVLGADMPDGFPVITFRASYYEQEGAAPAATDPILKSEEKYWTGSAVTETPAEWTPSGADWLSKTDVEALFGAKRVVECADDDADGVADPAVISAILDTAMAEAEEILARFTLPAAGPWPPALVDLGARIAWRRLLERRGASDKDSGGFIERLADDIADIRAGKKNLKGLTAKALYATGAKMDAEAENGEPKFGRQSDGTTGLDQF